MVEKLGIIGLGNMGKPIALNLMKTFKIVVYDLSRKVMDELTGLGAEAASSPYEMGEKVKTIFLSLPGPVEVESAVLGDGGILSGPHKSGLVIIDLSTSDPETTERIATIAESMGVFFLDAPVTGGQKRAFEGTLTIMVGGDHSVFLSKMDLFRLIGKSIFYTGCAGSGHKAKILHNLVAGCNIAVLAEVFAMAKKLGIDAKLMMDIINEGAAESYMSRTKGYNHILPEKYDGPAKIKLIDKDFKIGLAMARKLRYPLHIVSLVVRLVERAMEMKLGEKDSAALVQFFESLAVNHFD